MYEMQFAFYSRKNPNNVDKYILCVYQIDSRKT